MPDTALSQRALTRLSRIRGAAALFLAVAERVYEGGAMPPGDRNDPRDPTPIVGSQTDMAPLGRSGAKPPHERTADEEADFVDWDAIAATAEFRELLKGKRRFIIPATIFFVVYYFALPYLVGYHTELMQRKVWGEMNWAYLFALSQFFMAWILAGIYVVVAAGWDRKAKALLESRGR